MSVDNQFSKSSYNKPKIRYRSQYPSRIDWDKLEPVIHPNYASPYPTTKREAKARFNKYLEDKDSHIVKLRKFLAAHGIELSSEEESVQKINDFFVENVDADEETENFSPEWWLFLNLVSLYLGELVLSLDKSGNIRWDVENVAFPGEDPSYMVALYDKGTDYWLSLDFQLLTYCREIIAFKQVWPKLFATLVKEILLAANRERFPEFDEVGLDGALELTFDDFK